MNYSLKARFILGPCTTIHQGHIDDRLMIGRHTENFVEIS